jgi:hypothetical protein
MLPPRFVLAVAALGCALAAIPSQATARGYLTQWGCGGNPRSLAVPNSGEPVYVGDNTSVTQYSASGQFLSVWNPGPPAPVAFPSVSPASDGVWVGSYRPFPRVQRFSVSGSQLAGWLSTVYAGASGVSAVLGALIDGREVVVIVREYGSLAAFDTSGRPLGELYPRSRRASPCRPRSSGSPTQGPPAATPSLRLTVPEASRVWSRCASSGRGTRWR